MFGGCSSSTWPSFMLGVGSACAPAPSHPQLFVHGNSTGLLELPEWSLALLCDEAICISNNGELDALQAWGKETWLVEFWE